MAQKGKVRRVRLRKVDRQYSIMLGHQQLTSTFCEEFEKVTGYRLENYTEQLVTITVEAQGDVRSLERPTPAPLPRDFLTVDEEPARRMTGRTNMQNVPRRDPLDELMRQLPRVVGSLNNHDLERVIDDAQREVLIYLQNYEGFSLDDRSLAQVADEVREVARRERQRRLERDHIRDRERDMINDLRTRHAPWYDPNAPRWRF